jgi:hypothetical protein
MESDDRDVDSILAAYYSRRAGVLQAYSAPHENHKRTEYVVGLENEVTRLREKLKKIENLSKNAGEQVKRNPVHAKEVFWLIYHHSK